MGFWTAIATHPVCVFALDSKRNESYDKLSFATSCRKIELESSMPRVGEFCPSNIARLLLGVVITVTLLTAIGFWLYNAPGHGTSIEQPAHAHNPAK
jgi:hypothetical protein